MKVEGAGALVTGASSGIGAALAVQLARRGATVLAHGRDQERLAALPDVTPIVADLATMSGPVELAERVLAAGRIDLLVSNAGSGWAGPFTEMTGERLDEVLAVNLRAPIRLARALLPAMLEHGRGHLVFVGSIAGRLGVPREAAYAAAKAGLDVFAESLRQELAGTPVHVTLAVPAVVDTAFFDRRGAPYDRRRPRPIPADRVAAAILDAVEHDRPEVYLPSWMRLPVVVRSLIPGGYRRLARRFG
jgi:short-subunit dehydrogenase